MCIYTIQKGQGLILLYILVKQFSSPSVLGNAVFKKPLLDQDGLGRGNKQKANNGSLLVLLEKMLKAVRGTG